MDIIETINKINETYEYVYDTYGFAYGKPDPNETFMSGFCYEYFNILHRFFPSAKLMMQNDKMHCAALIDDDIYDVTGLRCDKLNFHEATGADIEYIYKRFGMFPLGFKDILNICLRKNMLIKSNCYTKKRKKQPQI